MSYLRKLDQARGHLAAGDLLAAEQELREATREWKSSRLRAPLVEKGIEPALRTIGRVFGRKSEEPVLPVFSRRAELLREDLHGFARSLGQELLEDVGREDLEPARRHSQAVEALTLQRSSEFFHLTPEREWEVVRVWLTEGGRLGRGIRPELLPQPSAPARDAGWWLEWLEGWCSRPAEPVRAFADWARRLAVGYQEDPSLEERVRWAWVEARLAMLDPLAAPLARPPLERVLASGDAGLRPAALRSWAELVTNLRYLATPGGNPRELLESRAMDAARAEIAWPPVPVVRELDRRRPSGPGPVFVAVAWLDDASAVALVLHDGRAARDVLCLKPGRDFGEADPFAVTEAEAQRRIAAWMPADAILLAAEEPGARLKGLVGSARWIPVDSLVHAFGAVVEERPAAAPATDHPAWTREICAPWDALVPAARRLLPAFERLLGSWPSLVTAWGRENLRRVGQRGVPLATALADAAGLVQLRTPVPLVTTAPPLSLQWPPLAEREWPRGGVAAPGPLAPSTPAVGRHWIDRRADASELAAVGVAEGPATLLSLGTERVLELADAAAATRAPGTIAVVGPEVPCAAPLIDLLNRWITESAGDLGRGRAAVWLLAVLGESVGPLQPLLERAGDEDLVAEVRAVAGPCTGDCGSHEGAACWPGQAEERMLRSRLAVVDVGQVEEIPIPGRRVVADDLRSWVTGTDDGEALRRLRLLPGGADPATVFTPGAGILLGLAGGVPAVDGGDAGWTVSGAAEGGDGLSIWAAPPGYGPRSRLLARESRSLLEERSRRWIEDLGEAPSWGEDLPSRPARLAGVADAPTEDTVLVNSLGAEDLVSPLLAGLRLAAARSHASRRLVVLSPALCEIFGLRGGLVYGPADGSVPAALESGARLLGDRRGRPPASWQSPLTRQRLDEAGAVEAREVAAALARWGPGRGRILAEIAERDRDAVIEVLCRLQAEALDGGPLGVRAVVVVTPELPAQATRLSAEVRLRSLDRGRKLVSRLAVGEIADDGVEIWARRNPAVVWIFRNAETLLDGDVGDGFERLLAAIRRGQSRALFFTDRAAAARAVRDRIAAHFPVDPVAVVAEHHDGLDAADWSTRNLGALEVPCPACDRPVAYPAAFTLCPDCGIPVDGVPSIRRALRAAFEGRVVEALRQRGPQGTWTMLVFDEGRRSRLHQRLGLGALGADEAPLLAPASGVASAEILTPADLWRAEVIRGPVIVCGLPDRLGSWTEVAGRLRARGLEPGEWWLAPPGLDESVPLPHAETELLVDREEFVRGLEEGSDRARAMATVRRLEAAGGGWSGTNGLRVHELVRSAQSDEGALLALAEAQRRGWVGAGHMTGLERPAPARLERAVRGGERLDSEAGARPAPGTSRPGRLLGIAGSGKTTALARAAESVLARGGTALVIVPTAQGRVEWLGVLSDPGLCCLDFDEFLLALVANVSGEYDLEEQLRVLPPAGSREGDDARVELVERVSRTYESRCGEVPAVEGRVLVRALEGETLRADPVAAESTLDWSVLAECVREARNGGGWTDSRELLARGAALLESSPGRARNWAARFDAVFVDDAHDLPLPALDFLRAWFGDRLAGIAVDPVLGLISDADVDRAEMESRRFGPAIAQAIEHVWRATTPLPARVKGNGSVRSTAESGRVLALTAAIDLVAGEIGTDPLEETVAVVSANERDRRLVLQQLGLRGIGAEGPDPQAEALVTGPRELLAALAWIAGAGADAQQRLLAVVIGAGPEPAEAEAAAHYEARLRRRLDGEEVEILDRVEAFLQPLVLLRQAIDARTRVESAVDVLLGCGLLERLREQPAIPRRISRFVRSQRGLTVAEVLENLPVERILDPGAPRPRIQVLGPEHLAGRVFDHLFYLCTGFESPERHYRVLSRAKRSVRIACSEVDLLQG